METIKLCPPAVYIKAKRETEYVNTVLKSIN